jgi:hypothetical protein
VSPATEVRPEDTTLQLYLRGLPLGVKATLQQRADSVGITITAYCKSILVQHALTERIIP